MSNLMIEHIENFNPRDENHRMIRRTNNAIMLHKIHQYLKNRTDLNLAVDKKEFAYWMTALGMNESTSFTKASGINNHFGITATAKQIKEKKAKLVGTHEIGEVEGQGTKGKKGTQKRYFANYKTEKEGMDAFFNDVILPNFPDVMKARNSTEFILALMKGKDDKMYATDFKFRQNMPRQSALAPVLEDTGELEPNIFANQYWLKFHNFLGGVTRPSMTTKKIGNEVLIVPSEEGKRGKNHSPRGIKGGQYIDQKLFEQLENDPQLIDKVKNQKENINNNLSEKYMDDILPSDVVTHGMTKEMMLNSLAAGNTFRLEGAFEEKFNDTYGVFGGIEIETDDSIFGVEAETDIFQNTQEIDDIDFKIKAEKDGVGVYGGQRKGKDYFGATIKKELEKGVRFEGGFEKDDDKKKGKIKLEVDF